MKPLEENLEEQKYFDYGFSLEVKPEVNEKFKETTVKGSQFKQPLRILRCMCRLQETPYAACNTVVW